MTILTKNAQTILGKRYFRKDEQGTVVEDWPQLCQRVARHVASAEANPDQWENKFYWFMFNLDFLPNSPVLRNFGTNGGCGSACFVLPIEDDLSSIYETLRKASLVQKFGGGTGFSFSRLRPENAVIKKTGGNSTGPISFMKVYDFSLGKTIRQGGTRPGANMGVLRVDHPDILKFIRVKRHEGQLENFNISVGLTHEFMDCLEKNEPFELQFEGQVYQSISPKLIWDSLVESAWTSGEPGVVFLDWINAANVLREMGEIESTNPCGEQPLLPYGSCTLGSINLSNMVIGDWTKAPGELDNAKLDETVRTAVRFLDNVITKNNYPLKELADMANDTRQIGLGVMGFADLCIKMHIRYGSEESVQLAAKLMKRIDAQARKMSEAIGAEKGHYPALKRLQEGKDKKRQRRNALLTSCAPTGTLSNIADCSGGIEPHFSFNFGKNCLGNEELMVVPGVLKQWVKSHGPEGELPAFFVTAGEVSPMEHLAVQAAFQNNGVDSAVSKTVNLPNDAKKEQIAEVFIQAWKLGCKGVTVYREGSRNRQALVDYDKIPPGHETAGARIKQRPRATSGPTISMRTACGKLYATPAFDGLQLHELFMRSSGGGCEAMMEAVGTLISYLVRCGGDTERIVTRLLKIKCPACVRAIENGKNVEVQSCAAGVGTAMKIALDKRDGFIAAAKAVTDIEHYFLRNGKSNVKPSPDLGECPDCHKQSIKSESGCVVCITDGCGYSKC